MRFDYAGFKKQQRKLQESKMRKEELEKITKVYDLLVQTENALSRVPVGVGASSVASAEISVWQARITLIGLLPADALVRPQEGAEAMTELTGGER
jgi:hypothetical protein